jgi:hypothetical protein
VGEFSKIANNDWKYGLDHNPIEGNNGGISTGIVARLLIRTIGVKSKSARPRQT